MDQTTSPWHEHDDHAVRAGFNLAWECSICHRVQVTNVDLRTKFSVPA